MLACLVGQVGWATVFAGVVLVAKIWSCLRLRTLIGAQALEVDRGRRY